MLHLLLGLNKGKGVLVVVYLMMSLLVTGVLVDTLHKSTSGIFSKIDYHTTLGISFLFASVLTYLTKDNYYKDAEGHRKKMETVNSFIFISMKIWAIIFAGAALFYLGNLVFHYLKPATF